MCCFDQRRNIPSRDLPEELVVANCSGVVAAPGYLRPLATARLPHPLHGQFPNPQPSDYQIVNVPPTHLSPTKSELTDRHLADFYAAALKQRGNGWGRRALRRLIGLKRTYPSGPFIAAIEQALQYGLFDLGRLEALILKQVAGDFFALDAGDDGDA